MTPLLEGVRVLEISAVVMGPFAGQILADLGAEVIKIEPPGGDVARTTGRSPLSGMSPMYVNNNRNKRTLSLDLKSEGGREVARRLAARSDVLLHNMREDAVTRLGLDYRSVAAIRPDIIYCAAIGFGQGGRYRDRPAYDDVIQAASGFAGVYTHLGEDPRLVPTIVADKIAALYAVYGVLAALLGRERGRTGGLRVEVPMFEAAASFMLNEHLAGATFSDDVEDVGYHRLLGGNRRPQRTLDGWVMILPYTRPHWERFLIEIGREDITLESWFSDSSARSARIDQLYAEIASAIATRRTRDWLEVLERLDIPGSRVNDLSDLLRDPHLADIGFFDVDDDYPSEIRRAVAQPVVFSGAECRRDRAAPIQGQDTRAILAESGFTVAEVEAFLQAGVAVASQ